MDRKKWRLILNALQKIKCKLTCCCQSSCNQPQEDRTELRWVDDKGTPKKQIII